MVEWSYNLKYQHHGKGNAVPADLIVYALVAAGLIFWLRSILGTKSGDEPSRPPYLQPEKIKQDTPGGPSYAAGDQGPSAEERIIALAERPARNLSVENKSAETGLLEISRIDRSFDINRFLEGAQDAFAMIVEAFAAGERDTLRDLLADPVYKAFEGVIAGREERGEKAQTEIHAIRKAEVLEARVQNKTAFITVRFTAEETGATRDAAGEIISGHPEKLTLMRDVWTFGRKLNTKDPRWLVYETRDDQGDEPNSIPNS
jgi:predicted lipid-binding transport protein (Tim44 family)